MDCSRRLFIISILYLSRVRRAYDLLRIIGRLPDVVACQMKTAWCCTKRLKGYTEIAVILPINCRQIADKFPVSNRHGTCMNCRSPPTSRLIPTHSANYALVDWTGPARWIHRLHWSPPAMRAAPIRPKWVTWFFLYQYGRSTFRSVKGWKCFSFSVHTVRP